MTREQAGVVVAKGTGRSSLEWGWREMGQRNTGVDEINELSIYDWIGDKKEMGDKEGDWVDRQGVHVGGYRV